jgi:hypothetical protein
MRLVVLLLLTGAAVQLVLWNRAYDPRFYQFLSTPPGRTLSRVMKWPNLHNHRQIDKTEEELTDEELVWKRKLEKGLRESWPTHRLLLRNGGESLGRILSETEQSLLFRESFGGQGRIETDIPKAMIEDISPWRVPIPEVTWRDIRFQMEYPDFQLTWFGHYTVLTDAPYYQVAASVRELENLHRQYMDLFGSLLRFPKSEQRLQVLFFSREDQYRAHQITYAPSLSNSSGYYSPLEDRMVIFNQSSSAQSQQMREEVRVDIEQMFLRARTPEERKNIRNMQVSVEEQLRKQGERETVATLRHEAVHHLSYTHGVHSWVHAENAWEIEGLAVYFEPNPPGDVPVNHLASLLKMDKEDRVPRLATLLNIRQPDQFQTALPGVAPHEAYTLSWSLVHLCMQPRFRPGFFDYLRRLQQSSNLRELVETPRDILLARALGLDPQELEDLWMDHIRHL